MNELIEKAIREQMCKDVDGTNFYVYMHRNGHSVANLVSDVKELIFKYNLSASESKGFLEYMKLVIDNGSYLPAQK